MSIGPGAESVGIELYTAASVTNRWGRAIWDGDHWANPRWQPVECEVLEAEYRTGAGAEAGVLSVAEAGELSLRTYDPDRLLDPMNTASPYFGAVKPGTPVRLVGKVPAVMPAWTGYLDEGRYQLATSQGRLRGLDSIAQLAQAEIAEGTSLPNTLRARVRAVVAAAGLGGVVPVQPEAAEYNVLYEGGAEQYPDAYNITPPGWVITGGAGTLGTSSNAPRSGVRAFNARGPVNANNTNLQTGMRVVGGAAYVFSAWRFREDWADGNVNMYVHMYAADGSYVTNSGGAPLTWAPGLDPSLYAQRSQTIVMPANVAQVGYQIDAVGGSDWIDDVTLVGPNPDTMLPGDPPVAPHDGKARSAWAIIQDAALDALTYVWISPDGVLRFTPWGSLPDAKFAVGCAPGGETGGAWLNGLASLEDVAQAESIRNSVRAYSTGTTWQTPVRDANSVAVFGERRLDVPRVVPDFATWAGRILADRADSGLEVNLGEVRPYSAVELALLLEGGADGPSALRVADDTHGTPVDLTVAVVGAGVGVTENGWRFRMVTMIPRAEWDQEVPPVIPPTPPGGTYHTETRTYVATSDALIALTSGGAKYGAGASSTLPVGAWSGWTYRALIQFPNVPGTKLRRLISATLNLDTTTQVRVGFGSSPTIECKRITGTWSAGSSSSPGSGNAVVWPGPAVTGSVRANVTGSQDAAVGIRVDDLVRPWLPAEAGGSLAAQRGLALYPGSGSTADTTEFWPVEKGGARRPELVLVLEVFD